MHYIHTSADAHVHICKVTHTRRKPRSRGKKYGRVQAHEQLRKGRRKKLMLSIGGLVKEERPCFLPGKGPEGGAQHSRTRECALGHDREHGWIYTYTTYIYTQDIRARIVGRMG